MNDDEIDDTYTDAMHVCHHHHHHHHGHKRPSPSTLPLMEMGCASERTADTITSLERGPDYKTGELDYGKFCSGMSATNVVKDEGTRLDGTEGSKENSRPKIPGHKQRV